MIRGCGSPLRVGRQDLQVSRLSWLPKLSDRAVVIFHDIAVRHSGFGVWRLWEEVRQRFPTFEFAPQHGLGVAAVGKGVPDGLRPLLALEPADALQFGKLLSDPLLERSRNAVVVHVSSGMGSFGMSSESARMESTLVGLAYPSSKAALNMLTTMYAKAYPQMRINSVDPGQTRTEMTGGRGLQSV